MTSTLRNLAFSATALAAIGSAALAHADTAKPDAAAAPADKVGTPPAGKALVVFFRPSSLLGAAVAWSVREGDAAIAKVGNGSYQVIAIDPGPHTYQLKSEVTDKFKFEADAGEVYYVKETMDMGLITYRPRMSQSNKAAFDAISDHLRQSKFVPDAAKTAAASPAPAESPAK